MDNFYWVVPTAALTSILWAYLIYAHIRYHRLVRSLDMAVQLRQYNHVIKISKADSFLGFKFETQAKDESFYRPIKDAFERQEILNQINNLNLPKEAKALLAQGKNPVWAGCPPPTHMADLYAGLTDKPPAMTEPVDENAHRWMT